MIDKIAVVFYAITFITTYYQLYVYPKSKKIYNGVTWLLLSLLIEVSFQALIAGAINVIKIPINLWSMGAVNLLMGVVLYFGKYRGEEEKQKYFYDKYDIAVFATVFVLGFLFLISFKGIHINMLFFNSDAAVHYKNAMAVVRNQDLPTMYFSELWNCMAMRCVMPFIPEVDLYKVYIVMESIFLIMEIQTLFAIIREYIQDIKAKIMAIPILIFYAFGYPMMGYLYSFTYWGMGVMLIGALLLIAKYYREKIISPGFAVFVMMTLCNAVTMCYMLFGPFAFVSLALVLTYDYFSDKNKLDLLWIKLCMQVFLLPTAMAIYYCYFKFLSEQSLTISGIMQMTGGTYQENYFHFYWLILPVIIELYCVIRSKKIDEIVIFSVCSVVLEIVLNRLYTNGIIQYYYFSKYFYILWFFGYIMAFRGGVRILQHIRLIFIYLILALMMEMVFWRDHLPVTIESVKDIYLFNDYLYKSTRLQCSDNFLDECNYIIENTSDTDEVPLIVEADLYSSCYWYEGITGKDSANYYTWTQDWEKIKQKLLAKQTPYFMVMYQSALYQENQDFFNQFERIDYNDEVAVYKTDTISQ